MMNENFDYQAYKERMNSPGRWVYIVPVSGVLLTEAVNFEFRIKRIHLVSREKLPRIRKKLGIPSKISDLKKDKWNKDFFDKAETYAVTWFSDVPQKVKSRCRRTIRDELALLSLSELGFGKRRYGAYPSFFGDSHVSHIEEFLYETTDRRTFLSGSTVGKPGDIVLHGLWLNFQKKSFFLKLLKILNNEIRVSRNWRNDIERAAILIGQGLCSTNLSQSFLWNIIALETLFNTQGEKFSDEFPKLAEAFLGWVGFWHTENYAQRIKEIYAKRCSLVHEGISDQISIEDLLFTDDLVFHLLLNIIQHINIFDSKEAVIDFARKVEAEHILGVKQKVRPKTFTFYSRHYTERDLEEI